MPAANHQSIRHSIDRRLIIRLRIFSVVFLVMLGVVAVEVFGNTISIGLALVGMLLGGVLGIIVSRIYRVRWDVQTMNVVGQIDWIGGIILAGYIAFALARNWVFGHWIQASTLAAFGLSMSAGTMLGRVVGISHGIRQTLQALGMLEPRGERDA